MLAPGKQPWKGATATQGRELPKGIPWTTGLKSISLHYYYCLIRLCIRLRVANNFLMHLEQGGKQRRFNITVQFLLKKKKNNISALFRLLTIT